MTSDIELFSELWEKDLKMHIKMGDDGKYSVNCERKISRCISRWVMTVSIV